MKNAIVIQHVEFEDAGHLAPLLQERGYRVTTYRPPGDEVWSIDPQHVDLLIILGGPMSANDHRHDPAIADELRLASIIAERGIPLLGICLGAQIIALALGGTVAPMPAREIGLAPIRLTPAGLRSPLRHLPAGQPLLHWHGEAITLPPQAERLAETDACAVQAFRIGTRILGLQFHPEAELHRLREWTEGHAGEVRDSGVDAAAMLELAGQHDETMRVRSRQVFGEWLDGLPA